MLTEEKLQNFLDDLRLGKYDSERYNITNWSIIDKQNKSELVFFLHKEIDAYKKNIFGIYKLVTLKTPKYYIGINNREDDIEVSEELYNSFMSYFTEIEEKDKLAERLNITESFGL